MRNLTYERYESLYQLSAEEEALIPPPEQHNMDIKEYFDLTIKLRAEGKPTPSMKEFLESRHNAETNKGEKS